MKIAVILLGILGLLEGCATHTFYSGYFKTSIPVEVSGSLPGGAARDHVLTVPVMIDRQLEAQCRALQSIKVTRESMQEDHGVRADGVASPKTKVVDSLLLCIKFSKVVNEVAPPCFEICVESKESVEGKVSKTCLDFSPAPNSGNPQVPFESCRLYDYSPCLDPENWENVIIIPKNASK